MGKASVLAPGGAVAVCQREQQRTHFGSGFGIGCGIFQRAQGGERRKLFFEPELQRIFET